MAQEGFLPDFKKELAELADAHDNKIENQKLNFDCLKSAEQKVAQEADDILRIAAEYSSNPEQFILEGIEEYAKTEKIPLLAAKARILQYLSPEWKEKVDAEVLAYFQKFDLNAFVDLKAGTPESDEAIQTLQILRDEGYMPYFVIAVHYQDDPIEKKAALKKYQTFTKDTKKALEDAKLLPFEVKESFVLNPENIFPEAKKYLEGLKKSQGDRYDYAINLAYNYLTVGQNISREFEDFDCDETTLLLQKTASDEGLEIGNYMNITGHVALKLDGFPLVLDTYDIKVRTIEECAKQEGYDEQYTGSYYWRDERGESIAEYDKGDNYPKKITGYKKVENPWLVGKYEDISALISEKARQLVTEGQKDRAKLYYEKALQINPKNAYVWSSLADLLKEEGKKEEAKFYLEKALELNPNGESLHVAMAMMFEEEGQNAEAKIHYERGLDINPNSKFGYCGLARIFASEGKRSEAIFYSEKALRIDPKDMYTHRELANLLELEGDTEGAKSHYEEAIRINPKDEYSHTVLADLLKSKGQKDGAEYHYGEALESNPNYEYALIRLGDLLQLEGRNTEAKLTYEKIVNINPNNDYSHYVLASLSYSQIDYKNSRVYLQKFDQLSKGKKDDLYGSLDKKLKIKGY